MRKSAKIFNGGTYIREQIKNDDRYYLFLGEVQLVSGFEKVLKGLNRFSNLDIYVTGSNSRVFIESQ